MKKFLRTTMIAGLSILVFTSCENVTNKVETRLNELTDKADQLDSVINTEIDKVTRLDSFINMEDLKIKKLDSLVDKTSSKLDSIWKEYR